MSETQPIVKPAINKCCATCCFLKPTKVMGKGGLCLRYIDKMGFIPAVENEELCNEWLAEKPIKWAKIVLDIAWEIPLTIEKDVPVGVHLPNQPSFKGDSEPRPIEVFRQEKPQPKEQTDKRSISDVLKEEGLS